MELPRLKISGAIVLCLLFLLQSVLYSQPIKIAAIFAKTGIAAGITDEYRLLSLAVDKINREGGIKGRDIQVIELDNKSTAIGSQQAAKEAVKHKVVAAIGVKEYVQFRPVQENEIRLSVV